MKTFMLQLLLIVGVYLPTCQGQTTFQLTAIPQGGNTYKFKADLPPLTPLGGSQTAPFYSYFIDFADGHSEQGHLPPQPNGALHHFEIDHEYTSAPIYSPTLRVYNNYSKNERPPDSRIAPNTINVTKSTPEDQKPLLASGSNSGIHPTFIPRSFDFHQKYLIQPEDDVVMVLCYKNMRNLPQNGHLILMYNHKEEDGHHFEHNDDFRRAYYQENFLGAVAIPNMPSEANKYNDFMIWRVEDVTSKVERQLFVDLKVLGTGRSEDAKLAVAFVPDNVQRSVQVNDLTMTVTRSRDPNETVADLKQPRFGKTYYTYQVHFFNDKNGAAKNIEIKSWDILNNWQLDTNKIKVKKLKIGRTIYNGQEEIYPYCKISCPSGKLTFSISGVYLEGLESDEEHEPEDCFGYIEFEIRPKKSWKSTKAQSSIIFDTNDPIETDEEFVFPQNRWFLGIDAGLRSDIGDLDVLWNGTLQTQYLSGFARLRGGYRWSDESAILAELGLDPTRKVDDTVGMSLISYNLTSVHFNPQIEYRFTRWLRLNAGANLIYNRVSGVPIQPGMNLPTSSWILDTQWTPISTRILDLNIGGRAYIPLDFDLERNGGRWNVYTSIRIHISK